MAPAIVINSFGYASAMVMRLMFIRKIYPAGKISNKHTHKKVVEECVGISFFLVFFFFFFLFLHHLPPRRRFRDYAALEERRETPQRVPRSHQPPVNTFRLAMIENMSGG
jgi:UDP-N-acetylmuramyl pentapeptide phosphotransferase/UDP-N-acetylglucosamine-1-phosphate transferase